MSTRGGRPRGARHYQEYGRAVPARRDDRLVYQVAIGSPVADWLIDRDETLIANHHNFTPMRFLQAWDPTATHGVVWGRKQLQRMAGRSSLGIADSRFNQLDLEAAGFAESVVVPVLVDLASSDHDVDEELLQRLRDAKADGGRDWLFVGRIAPNKCQHDLVAALAAHRRAYGSPTRLHLVGGSTSASYSFALERFVAELGLEDAVEITGSVSAGALGAYYRAADVLVCVSEHEGFCVPVIEAMHHDVPVVAFGAGAVAETVGAGGLVLDRKDPETVATAVELLLADESLRAAFVAAGRARCAELDPAKARTEFVAAVERAGVAVKLSVVVPRYGVEVIGGCETAVRELSEWVVKTTDVEVEVLTTTALDLDHLGRALPGCNHAGGRGDGAPVPGGVRSFSRERYARRPDAPAARRASPRRSSRSGSTFRALPHRRWSTRCARATPTRVSIHPYLSGPWSPRTTPRACRGVPPLRARRAAVAAADLRAVVRTERGARRPGERGTPALRTSVRDRGAARHHARARCGCG